ncbi:MAG: DUF4344 domain-containing metallopeptidase [Pyrinomonadaceae bacterium]
MKKTFVLAVLFATSLVILIIGNSAAVHAQAVAGDSLDSVNTKGSIDRGDFKIGFSPVTLKRDPSKRMDAELTSTLKEMIKPLNQIVAMPYDVYLNFDTCGEPNAFYNPNAKEITMCYEFLTQFDQVFSQISSNPEEVRSMSAGAMMVFFFHELGHCLIDAWDLPTTGREEDAVDQLATVLLLGSDEGDKSVMSAVLFFNVISQGNRRSDLAFWDEHSLDQQRFYDMLCLTFGSNPTKHQSLLSDDGLPRSRAVRCPAEYKRVDRAWNRLLLPYLKQ